jgi:phospholipid/cholesterol/gamma-HCH transport system ATP-binding protein
MSATPLTPLVEIRNLSFGYGDALTLDALTLSVPRGKVTALMGPMGGGKTTTLRMIGGEYRARSGQVLFDGQDITPMERTALYAVRRRMGVMFQFGALFADHDDVTIVDPRLDHRIALNFQRVMGARAR